MDTLRQSVPFERVAEIDRYWDIEHTTSRRARIASRFARSAQRVPEPATAALLGVGLAWAALRRRGRN